MNVLIMDMGARLNKLGGEAKMANLLFEKLDGKVNTYYLGYETYYTTPTRNTIILERGGSINTSARNSFLSELSIVRAIYYFLYIRNMVGLNVSKGSILEKVKWMKPDIIISNSIQDFALLRYFKDHGIKFKSIYIDHGSLSTDNTSGYFTKEGIPLTIGTGINALSLNTAKRKFFNFFDMNIALNLSQFKAINKFTKKVTYIPNGLDIRVRKNPKQDNLLRKKYAISKNDFVVLYLGRMFDRQKNVSTLIKAFRATNSQHLKLLLVGEGPSTPSYKKLADGDKRIIFTVPKPVSEVNSIYNISNLFVLPSFWEGSTLTLLEAAGHGLPIILSKDAYTPDLRQTHIPRISSFTTTDYNTLKRQIELIFNNKSVREKSIASSRIVSKTFTEKKMLSSYLRLLQNLI